VKMSEPHGLTAVENGSDANGFKRHELTHNVIVSQQHAADAKRFGSSPALLELDLARQRGEAPRSRSPRTKPRRLVERGPDACFRSRLGESSRLADWSL
jgi:hypothetical protein